MGSQSNRFGEDERTYLSIRFVDGCRERFPGRFIILLGGFPFFYFKLRLFKLPLVLSDTARFDVLLRKRFARYINKKRSLPDRSVLSRQEMCFVWKNFAFSLPNPSSTSSSVVLLLHRLHSSKCITSWERDLGMNTFRSRNSLLLISCVLLDEWMNVYGLYPLCRAVACAT